MSMQIPLKSHMWNPNVGVGVIISHALKPQVSDLHPPRLTSPPGVFQGKREHSAMGPSWRVDSRASSKPSTACTTWSRRSATSNTRTCPTTRSSTMKMMFVSLCYTATAFTAPCTLPHCLTLSFFSPLICVWV